MPMEPLGSKLRRQRRKLGMTLDALAAKAAISKPYLSLIETGRVPNPPSDEKLKRLEAVLGFGDGELISRAHFQRTPVAVRAMLGQLIRQAAGKGGGDLASAAVETNRATEVPIRGGTARLIPIINAARTGYPRGFTDLSYPQTVSSEFLSVPGVDDKHAFAVRAVGDHMTPNFDAGDLVVFSPAMKVRSGDDCFVCMGDGSTTFRRIFYETEEAESVVRLQPRNEKHRSRSVPADRVAAVYKATYCLRRVSQD